MPRASAKQATVYLFADLETAYKNGFTRDPRGDYKGAHEWCFYGWLEGAAHVYLGPNNATDPWQIKKVNPQSMVHLTEQPVELAFRAMQYHSPINLGMPKRLTKRARSGRRKKYAQ